MQEDMSITIRIAESSFIMLFWENARMTDTSVERAVYTFCSGVAGVNPHFPSLRQRQSYMPA